MFEKRKYALRGNFHLSFQYLKNASTFAMVFETEYQETGKKTNYLNKQQHWASLMALV